MSTKKNFKYYYNKYSLIYLFLGLALYTGKLILYKLSDSFSTNYNLINMEIDNHIPFCKYFLIFYYTYYWYPIILLYLIGITDYKKFYRMFIGVILSVVTAVVCFSLYQVKMIRPEIIGNDIFDIWLKFTYALDSKALNCFPSVHSIFGTLMIIGGINSKKLPKWLNILSVVFGIGCIASTVFIKQHYFIDMIAGVLIMLIFYLIVLFIDKIVIEKR